MSRIQEMAAVQLANRSFTSSGLYGPDLHSGSFLGFGGRPSRGARDGLEWCGPGEGSQGTEFRERCTRAVGFLQSPAVELVLRIP